MAFRGDHAVRADHAGFAGLLPIAAEKSLRPSGAKFSRWGPARSRSTAGRSGSISRFYCTLLPRPSPARERTEIPWAAVATIRSKYLAKMSNSRFTGSPG